MSYFSVPRLHFSGSFRAAPSTMNNVDRNFTEPPVLQKLWNPNGTHDVQLLAGNEFTIPPGANVTPCRVTGIVTAAGDFITDPAGDSLIGQLLISTNTPSNAKLVDLDPDQQQVSQIWGLQLSIGPAGEALVADFLATNFQQLFPSRAPGSFGIGFSAAYQSQLANLQWPASSTSHLLQAWQSAGAELLSIRFTLDQLDVPARFIGDPNFTIGRISGTIGLASPDEPQSITVGRLLRPVQPFTIPIAPGVAKELLAGTPVAPADVNQNVNYAPALVDPVRDVLTIDLGNALPFNADATPADAGTLQAVILTSQGAIPLGTVANTLDNYLQRAFLFEFPLGGNSEAAASNPIAIMSNEDVVLSENSSGAWIDAAQHVYRMDAGTTASAILYATTFGATPADGQQVTLTTFAFPNTDNGNAWPAPTIPLTTVPSTVTLNAGIATFQLSAGTPGNPRGSLDGLVYGVTFDWAEDTNPVSGLFVNAHVFDALDAPAAPQWSDVEPIFQQFMTLYPAMQSILDLSDEATVQANAALVARYLSFPESSSQYMPVTRDLSGPKKEMLLAYLAAQQPQGGAQ
ncbi:MAG TPA: hypothetical protein VE974_18390 [Thermoanaerobaculia bacterium]|nr:hypothetical protein [Thermoanaerobaculia bacterium]